MLAYDFDLIIFCSDGALYEWDISTGTCVRTLISHSRGINFVYVSAHTWWYCANSLYGLSV